MANLGYTGRPVSNKPWSQKHQENKSSTSCWEAQEGSKGRLLPAELYARPRVNSPCQVGLGSRRCEGVHLQQKSSQGILRQREGTVVTADTAWAGKGSSKALGQLSWAHSFSLALLFRQDSDEDPAKTGLGRTQHT
jgi:hypothetical protein